MKDLREYPRTRYRRAWIVVDHWGYALRANGVGAFCSSPHAPGEVFYERKDAEYLLKKQRAMLDSMAKRMPEWAGKSKECRIVSIMVPRVIGPSEHVRVTRFVEAEAERTGYYPGGRISLERMLAGQR